MDKFPIKKTEHPKIRIGRKNDGGYVICDIPNIRYDLFLSGGVNDDVSFEEAFLHKFPTVPCYAFDGTIDKLPPTNYPIEFIRKNIGRNSTTSMTNLKEYISENKNIFMKMDIEGFERDLFMSLEKEDLLKLAQIVIEVHWAPAKDCVTSKLQDTHYLVHFHPNNFCKLDASGLPAVIELTYIRKDLCSHVEISTDPIPDPILDMKNIETSGDIVYRNGRFIIEPVTYKFDIKSRRIIPVSNIQN